MAGNSRKSLSKGKEKQETADSKYHEHSAALIVANIQERLSEVNCLPPVLPGASMKILAAEFREGIRPGDGLLGTAREEDALYATKSDFGIITNPSETPNMQPEAARPSGHTADSPVVKTEDDAEIDGFDYKPYIARRMVNDSDEEDLGEYEETRFGSDFVQLLDGQVLPIWEYLGQSWDERIEKLYSIQALKLPPNMKTVPRDFQLKAAAQGLLCLDGPHKFFMLGDEMGVGKTLTATLMMNSKKEEPGMSIVICPKNICSNWKRQIESAWESGHGLRAIILEDSSMSQTQLIAGGFDVVICSYEFFDANGRAFDTYSKQIRAKANNNGNKLKQPKRPTTVLHSELITFLKMPFKIGVLDECHKINKKTGLRHKALQKWVPVQSWLLLSGTLPHNKWHNFAGYLDFARDHPFTDDAKFLQAFSDYERSKQLHHPSAPKMRLLQKFLQAIMIARPASILNLPDCDTKGVAFNLLPEEEEIVSALTLDYERLAGISSNADGAPNATPTIDGAEKAQIFGKAVKARMSAFHPMLAELVQQDKVQTREFELGEVLEDDEVTEDFDGNARFEWLSKVQKRDNIIEESSRVTTLLYLYNHIQQNYPGEKVIFFSDSLKFLDIVAESFRRRHEIDPLRYDGSVPPSRRDIIEENFKSCNSVIPLLMTIKSGSEGLNIQSASIVVICEPQWNISVELQAIARAYRQGQQRIVKAFMVYGANSSIDMLVHGIQRRKTRVNQELMEPLVRTPDQGPAKIELLNFPGLVPLDRGLNIED